VSPIDRLAQILTETLAGTGAYAPAILFFGSFVEYVFPPFPGDTVVVIGAWYAVHGKLSWPLTFAAVILGAVGGAFIDYQVGAVLGRRLDRSAERRGPLTAERLGRVEQSYRRWGVLLLLANRFLPGIRAFVFLAAGAARIPLGKVLFFGGLSAALWDGLLLFAGALLVKSLPEMGALIARYTAAAWIAMAAVAGVFAALALWRRRAGRSPGGKSP
jgi:membrane-associated protein